MREELTNLLPADRKKAIGRLYTIRLATVTLLLLSFLIVSAVVLRAPIYVYQYQQIQIEQQESVHLASRLSDNQGKGVTARFKALNDNISYLSRLASTSSATSAVASVLNVSHQGVILSGLSYTPAQKGSEEKITLTGKATTRESLQQYVSTLSSLSSGKGAEVPISTYAKESDIPFTITLTGPLAL